MENTLTISAFVFALTQIVKDLGWVKGNYLKLVAIGFGAIATYLTIYQPELWAQLTGVLIAAGVTSGVSYVNQKAEQLSPAE